MKEGESFAHRFYSTSLDRNLPQGVDVTKLGTLDGEVDFRRLDDHGAHQLRAVVAHLDFRHASVIDPFNRCAESSEREGIKRENRLVTF